MKKKLLIALGAVFGSLLLLTVIGLIVGEEPAADTAADSKPASAVKKDEKDEKSDVKAEIATLPDMTGKGLQTAQDEAQAAGFFGLVSHDALGRGRLQALDRNWKVCNQTPRPGEHSIESDIDFGAVKLEEQCPGKDIAEPPTAGESMPDFAGKAVSVARRSLDGGASITVNDISGEDRMVLIESNWKVCGQQPAAGAALNGQPITFSAVKFEESC
ncbi:hypothetical protein [Streptomyces uncialis]|uniref:hypothetical protein n=1 Tax=Streptomyces uncialis TaxID=1048205 RepID=UPI0038698DE7|nr:hypothetical protein OG268_36545 [Streptomyces uncialis]